MKLPRSIKHSPFYRGIQIGLGILFTLVTGSIFAVAVNGTFNTFSSGSVLRSSDINANFATLKSAIESIDSSAPAGAIVAYSGTVAPSGWLLCNGQSVSRTTYAGLYAVIGNSFGSGDGSTTFHLPDFRGRFLRGLDGTANIDPDKATRTAMNTGGNVGNAIGSVQVDDFKSHRHAATDTSANGNGPTSMLWVNSASFGNIPHSYTQYSGGNETRPVNAYVNWIVKQ
jgi:microcystin-dependent protein